MTIADGLASTNRPTSLQLETHHTAVVIPDSSNQYTPKQNINRFKMDKFSALGNNITYGSTQTSSEVYQGRANTHPAPLSRGSSLSLSERSS